MAEGTSIGFGSGEVIIVGLSLVKTRKLVQKALSKSALLELEDQRNGEKLVINPTQVKVLQRAEAP